jgi:hypothetical protein
VPRELARRSLVAIALLAAAPTFAHADGVHLRLRGAARIDAQGVRADGGDLIVRGVVTDDAGAPLADGAITIAIARASAPSEALPLAGLSVARSCTPDGRAPRLLSDGAHVATDGSGRFCVRLSTPVDRYVAHVGYGGSEYVDPSAIDVQVDLSRRTCTLLFSPEPHIVRLDAQSLSLEAAAMLESDGVTSPGAGYALTLSSDVSGGKTVATATTDAAGRARFTLAPSQLGPPGRGELRLAFAGNTDAAAASRVAHVERRALVELDVAEANAGKLPTGSPEEGVAFTVSARAAGGDVTSGSVEARVGDTIVGAAPVEGGVAKLLITFGLPESSGAADELPVALRYVPSAPWYEAGNESTWRLPVRGRSPLRQGWVLLAGLAVAAWFVVTRVQRARAMAVVPPRPRVPSRGEAKLDLVRKAGAGEGWKGRVTDADDATGIAAARVQIERPAFGRADVLASVMADSDGRFDLPPTERRVGDELSIEAPLHVALRRPLPAPGELDAQLVLRKRALLGRLVAWARLRGHPFDRRPEPTPGHVRRAAVGDFEVVRWAEAVERAAFAGEAVDARVEADIDRLAPGAPKPAVEPRPARPDPDRRALANPTKPNR